MPLVRRVLPHSLLGNFNYRLVEMIGDGNGDDDTVDPLSRNIKLTRNREKCLRVGENF